MAVSIGSDRTDRAWYATLRNARPAAIVAVSADGKVERPIALASGRARWQLAIRTGRGLLEATGGHLEMRDAANGLMGVLRLEEPEATALEDDDEDDAGPGDAIGLSGHDARLLGVLISAQRMVLHEQRELLEPLLSGCAQLVTGFAQYAAQVGELARIASKIRPAEPDHDTSGSDALLTKVLELAAPRLLGAPEIKDPKSPAGA